MSRAELTGARQLIHSEDISMGRKSEIPVPVNTLEKIALLKFSIRGFGYVSVLGSQLFPSETRNPVVNAIGVPSPRIDCQRIPNDTKHFWTILFSRPGP